MYYEGSGKALALEEEVGPGWEILDEKMERAKAHGRAGDAVDSGLLDAILVKE